MNEEAYNYRPIITKKKVFLAGVVVGVLLAKVYYNKSSIPLSKANELLAKAFADGAIVDAAQKNRQLQFV